MKRKLLPLLFLCFFLSEKIIAQTVPAGMNYQAIARDKDGQVMQNQTIQLRITLGSADGLSETFYSETHEVATSAQGLFNLIIGRGQSDGTTLFDIPWATEEIWLNVEMQTPNQPGYKRVSSTQLLSVPYAFHAETANQLAESEEGTSLRNQSIYWTTSGNTKTRPNVHFLGTRDEQDLVFKTNNETRFTITKDGQFEFHAGDIVCGPDDQKSSYPMVVEGSNQGIWIQIKEARSGDNNFVTFEDTEGIQGRIEGETIGERLKSFDFIFTNVAFLVEIASNLTEGSADNAKGAGAASSGVAAGAAPGAIASGISRFTKWAALLGNHAKFLLDTFTSVGVTYESNGADYAEWLERAEGETDLLFGEIIGVKAGKISRKTKGADHHMVVSTNPFVLGNQPDADREKDFEKVAFMGQVPVRVVGPVQIGDYILPSGNNDGMGIAVSPAEMLTGDYKRIVGVAWQAAEGDKLNIVNIAVGINANDLSQKLSHLHARVDNIINYLEGTEKLMTDSTALAEHTRQDDPQTELKKLLSDEAFDEYLDQHADLVKEIYAKQKSFFAERGVQVEDYPELQHLFQQPVKFIKEMRRDPNYLSQWAMIDQQIKRQNK